MAVMRSICIVAQTIIILIRISHFTFHRLRIDDFLSRNNKVTTEPTVYVMGGPDAGMASVICSIVLAYYYNLHPEVMEKHIPRLAGTKHRFVPVVNFDENHFLFKKEVTEYLLDNGIQPKNLIYVYVIQQCCFFYVSFDLWGSFRLNSES